MESFDMVINEDWLDENSRLINSLQARIAQLEQERADTKRPLSFNEWFLSLPEGRQAALRDDKWVLAQAAFDVGQLTYLCAKPMPTAMLSVDWLSNVIRQADGNNTLGAGALADKIIEAIKKS